MRTKIRMLSSFLRLSAPFSSWSVALFYATLNNQLAKVTFMLTKASRLNVYTSTTFLIELMANATITAMFSKP